MVAGDKVVYSVIYDGAVKQLGLDVPAAPARIEGTGKGKAVKVKNPVSKKDVPRVFINPGHGGHDSDDRHIPTWVVGARDTLHYYESNSNLTKALALGRQARCGGQPQAQRGSDASCRQQPACRVDP